jgi:hypothetical protein
VCRDEILHQFVNTDNLVLLLCVHENIFFLLMVNGIRQGEEALVAG